MTTADPVLERWAPPPSTPVPGWLSDARGAVEGAADGLLALRDDVLPQRWLWRDDRDGGVEVRYVFYRALEAFERATARASAALGGVEVAPAQPPFARATMARWDLHGLLVPLHDADLDADPGGGEWTVRQTLGHAINVQRAYPAWSAWWIRRDAAEPLPRRAPDEVGEGFPEEDDDGRGSLAEVRRRLDEAVDAAAERLATLGDDELGAAARWSGCAVDVGFRLDRMSSHLQEHTVQVEKTLVMLGRAPREADRLLRLVTRAWGRLEAVVYGLPEAVADRARPPIEAAIAELTDSVEHVGRPGSIVGFEAE